jgi:arylformamidase
MWWKLAALSSRWSTRSGAQSAGFTGMPRASRRSQRALCFRTAPPADVGGCIVVTDWAQQGLPLDILKGALPGSGMYDLKPVRMSRRSRYVKFTGAMEQQLSAQRHLESLHTPLILTHGTLETPEFQRQSRDFYAGVKAAGKPVELRVGQGYNHYETQGTLTNPYGFMGRAAFEQMKLNTA